MFGEKRRFIMLFFAGAVLAGCAVQPPAKPVAQAPQVVCDCGPPAKEYLIFFAQDQAVLTPRDLQVIAMVPRDFWQINLQEADVSGFADRSETSADDRRLSMARAAAVAKQLVQDGVPAAKIVIKAYGARHFLVPPGTDGAIEPQNRRVEIWAIFSFAVGQ